MNCTLLPAGSDLIGHIAARFKGRGPDISDTLVVFPGLRPRAFLLKRLADDMGRSFLPPRITTFAGLIDLLYGEHLGLSSTHLDPFDAVAMLHDAHGTLAGRIGGRAFDSIARFYPLGARIFSEFEEAMRAGADAEALLRASDTVPVRDFASLARMFDGFYASVASLGAATPAMRLREVASQYPVLRPPAAHCIFAVPRRLDRLEARVLVALLEHAGTELVVQDGPGLDALREVFGIPAARNTVMSRPLIALTAATDTHGQVFALAQRVRELVEAGETPAEDTVIALPNAEPLFPVLQHVLPLLGEAPWNVSLGYPLPRTPLYAFLSLLFRAVLSRRDTRYSAADYTRFILHPYVKNIIFAERNDIARIMFHAIERHFIDRRVDTFTLEALEQDEVLFERIAVQLRDDAIAVHDLRNYLVAVHDATLRAVESAGNISAFASTVIQLLDFIENRSTASRHSDYRMFAGQLMDALWRVQRSSLATSSFAGLDDCVALFHHIAADIVPHFPGTPLNGLQVLGMSETRSLRFRRVVFLEAQDDALPGGRGVPPLIPPRARELLGMRTHRDSDDDAAYLVHQLLSGATEAEFYFSDGHGKQRSRFVERALWDMQQRDGSTGTAQYIASVVPSVLLANEPPGEIVKTPAIMDAIRTMTFSATGLDQYLRCQRQFYFARLLRLSERDELSDDVDAADVGVLVHSILQLYHAPHTGRPLLDSDADEQRMDAIVVDAFAAQIGEAVGGRVLMLEQIRARMREYVREYLRPAIEKHSIVIEALEQRLAVRFGTCALAGTLDRIERRDGRVLILDYKTGGSSDGGSVDFDSLDPDDRDTWTGAIGSLQLPVYHLLYAAGKDAAARAAMPLYLRLNARDLGANIEEPMCAREEQLDAALSASSRVIEAVLREINDASVPFRPPQETGGALADVCPFCAFRTLCGTQWLHRPW